MSNCRFCGANDLTWVDVNAPTPRPNPGPERLLTANMEIRQAEKWELRQPDGNRHTCEIAREYYRCRYEGNSHRMIEIDNWLQTHQGTDPNVILRTPPPAIMPPMPRRITLRPRAGILDGRQAQPIPVPRAEQNIWVTAEYESPRPQLPQPVRPLLTLAPPIVVNLTQERTTGAIITWAGVWEENKTYTLSNVVLYNNTFHKCVVSAVRNTKPGASSWTNPTASELQVILSQIAGTNPKVTEKVEPPNIEKRSIKI